MWHIVHGIITILIDNSLHRRETWRHLMSMRTYVTRTSTALATATAALGVLTPTSHAGSQAKASSEPAAHERPALAVVSGPAAVPVTLAAVGESTAGSLALVPAASQGSVHVVAGGETLSGIARRHSTTASALASANGIADPDRIFPGQRLTIPTAVKASASVPSDPVPKTFLHYTYSDEVNAAANRNRASLEGVSTPSAAKMREIVREAAAKMGVDPRLALAHASVESDFDMRTVSPANAVGVMQVIPSSGEWASRMVGRQLNLLDPQDNAVAGVAIIRYLQKNADDMDQGIAGYYQGLGGVKKTGMRPDTQKYVAKVRAAMAQF
ncbi:MAG: transglycosylase SLT domain-containing protein [Peptidiphaga sp.]|jgi:putative lysM domain protein|uniref:lytic transglycosylase n=1 Tax=Peptidiphaga sp. TaxID=2848648 RepID=UPI000F2D256F|nr:MAG: LysM peptidoglycan-binding domain-containing protein [Actinomyces sp.]